LTFFTLAGIVIAACMVLYYVWVRWTATPDEVEATREKMDRIKAERKRAWRNPHYREPK
jgi:hypothetical protein